ncbi:MAG: cobalamin-dependent protein [Spirochaetales bacterium]|nr:cobalamin-dependent protein [Spirochaetales bacterium]
MNLNLDEVIKEARSLPLISLQGMTNYQKNIPKLQKYVDDTMSSHPSINKIIGNKPLEVMYANHKHHAAFMLTVFSIGNYELLARTIPWVYRAYSAHNFSYDYFPLELEAWLEAVGKYTALELTKEIKLVYEWMIKKHENMISLSQSKMGSQPPISENWLETKNSFFTAILEGDHKACLKIAMDAIPTGKEIESFYLHVIQPVMYEVGILWERGTISVAQEHLASAIVGRVMASTSMLNAAPAKYIGKAVITAAPNEFHEIGAWMISDILENEGWNVKYLGADTPAEDLLEMLHSFQPQVLALSITMPFNILKAKEMIGKIRENEELKKIQIIIGGRVFNENTDLWRSTGADHFAANAHDIKAFLGEKSA